jgi:hypothetical protein
MVKITKPEMLSADGSRRKGDFINSVKLLFLLAVIGAVMSLMMYLNSQTQLKAANARLAAAEQQLADYKNNPSAASAQETQDLISKVSLLVVLPQDEQPTVATVTDLSKLQDQPFFANARLGDKVLIYTNAKKAILYRPGENKIIEIAPLNLGDPTSGGTTTTGTASKAPVKKTNQTNTP